MLATRTGIALRRRTSRVRTAAPFVGSVCGQLARARMLDLDTNAGACGESKRWVPLVLLLAPPMTLSARTTVECGLGTPAAEPIRCTGGQALAHRDRVLLRCSVVPMRIAMGPSFSRGAEMSLNAVAGGPHSAAKGIGNGHVAEGGRLSPTGDARPAAEW